MNKGILAGVGVLIGLAVVAVVLVNTTKMPATSSPSPVSQEQPMGNQNEATAPAQGEQAAKEVTVSGNEYSFMPSSLNLKKGETVKLTLKNTGALPHDLVIDELGVATKTIKSGDSDTVTFTADKAGNFKFYCSIGNHRAKGMEGTAAVE
jgi:nitrosocyanin